MDDLVGQARPDVRKIVTDAQYEKRGVGWISQEINRAIDAALKVQADEIERLTRELAEARGWAKGWHGIVDTVCTVLGLGTLDAPEVVEAVRGRFEAATARATAAEAREAAAIKALEPFSSIGELIELETEGFEDGDELSVMFHDYLFNRIPVSAFRRAAALAQQEGQDVS